MAPALTGSAHASLLHLFSWPNYSCTWKRIYPARRPA